MPTDQPSLNISALLIERDLESANLIRAILEPWGVAVRRASSIVEGQRMLAEAPPDVILCDIAPPHAEALEFVRRLRAFPDRTITTIPTIGMSATHEYIETRTVRAAGFNVLLRKPVDPDQLPHTVALLVATRRT